MVTPNQNLILEIHLGSHKNQHLWQSSSPFHFSHPFGWTLTRHGQQFRLSQGKNAFDFSEAEGRQGVTFPSDRGDSRIRLQIRPATRLFQSWLDQKSIGSGSGRELMVIRGHQSALTRSAVVTEAYECSHFTLKRKESGWQLTALDPSVKVFEQKRELAIDSEVLLPWGSLESLRFQQGETWWKFKPVATWKMSFPAEKLVGLLPYLAVLYFMWAAVVTLPKVVQQGQQGHIEEVAALESIRLTSKPKSQIQEEEVPVAEPGPAISAEPEPQPAIKPESLTEVPKKSVTELPVVPMAAKPTKTSLTAEEKEAKRVAREEKKLQKKAALLKSQLQQWDSTTVPKAPEERQPEKRSPLLAGPIPFEMMPADSIKPATEQIALQRDLTQAPRESSGLNRPNSEAVEVAKALKVAAASTVEIEENSPYTVRGGLTSAQVEAAVTKQIDSVRNCYENALGRKSGLSGKMTLSFVIGVSGKVEATRISESNLEDVLLSKCVVQKINNWNFPIPSDAHPVSVSYPFVFKTVGVE